MAKISDLITSASTADSTLAADQAALAEAETTDVSAHGALVAGLATIKIPVVILQPDGSYLVYQLDTTGTTYTVTAAAGADAAVPDPPVPTSNAKP